jgi:RNA polymerase sigma-70 factor (ECF subfamily)
MDSLVHSRTENRGYRERTDEELTTICVADREAFGELARRYRPLALRAALCVLRNGSDAEDQVQSALCKALQHIHSFRRSAKFSTWLVRIVVNECLMQLRQKRYAATVPLDSVLDHSFSSALLDGGESPEVALDRIFFGQLLEREIRRIPPVLRNAFLLRDVQQRPFPEVAACLGTSVSAAKGRISRAREELRRRLELHTSAYSGGSRRTSGRQS